MKPALLFCLLVASVLIVSADHHEESDVVVLTDANFHTKTAEGAWLTEFYAPWCGHCKNLAPTWESLATALKGEVNVGKVDCTVEKNTCSQFGIRGYPTIKFLNDGKVYEYNGGRSVEAFSVFAREGYKSVTPKELPGAQKKEEPVASNQEGTSQVVALTANDFYSQVKEGVWLVKFYAPWCGHCKHLVPTWDSLATKTEGKFKVAKVDCTVHRSVCEDFKITGYPTLKLIKEGKVYTFSGARNEASFLSFVNEGYTGVEASTLPHKEPVKEADTKPKEVVVLTDASFDEKVTQGEWLVEFYAPWCGHCKHLAPIWTELATKAPVNVAKVDCTVEKELMGRFGIKGFPTIKFIKDGKVYDFKGSRTVEEFITFAKSGYESATVNPFPVKAGKDEL